MGVPCKKGYVFRSRRGHQVMELAMREKDIYYLPFLHYGHYYIHVTP